MFSFFSFFLVENSCLFIHFLFFYFVFSLLRFLFFFQFLLLGGMFCSLFSISISIQVDYSITLVNLIRRLFWFYHVWFSSKLFVLFVYYASTFVVISLYRYFYLYIYIYCLSYGCLCFVLNKRGLIAFVVSHELVVVIKVVIQFLSIN